MQHKDTSQQAFLIIYLMCILSFIYLVDLGEFSPWPRLMSDSEVNRLKTGAFTFSFETLPHLLVCVTSLVLSVSPHSSCLCHLTRLVCVTSLVLSVSPHSSCLCHLTLLVCVTSLFLSVSPHSSCLCHLTLLVCVTSLFSSVSPHSSCQSSLFTW